jgi:hypothetical protein
MAKVAPFWFGPGKSRPDEVIVSTLPKFPLTIPKHPADAYFRGGTGACTMVRTITAFGSNFRNDCASRFTQVLQAFCTLVRTDTDPADGFDARTSVVSAAP